MIHCLYCVNAKSYQSLETVQMLGVSVRVDLAELTKIEIGNYSNIIYKTENQNHSNSEARLICDCCEKINERKHGIASDIFYYSFLSISQRTSMSFPVPLMHFQTLSDEE